MSSTYRAVTRQAIIDAGYPDHADEATITLIEDCLRSGRTGLDGLRREELIIETAAAIADLARHPEQAADLCSILGFSVPGWATAPTTPTGSMSLEVACAAIERTLATAFPATRFDLTAGKGAAAGHVAISWTDGPMKRSVDDVLAQFLPGRRRYGPATPIVVILTGRIDSARLRGHRG